VIIDRANKGRPSGAGYALEKPELLLFADTADESGIAGRKGWPSFFRNFTGTHHLLAEPCSAAIATNPKPWSC